jgi:hypothetical protein
MRVSPAGVVTSTRTATLNTLGSVLCGRHGGANNSVTSLIEESLGWASESGDNYLLIKFLLDSELFNRPQNQSLHKPNWCVAAAQPLLCTHSMMLCSFSFLMLITSPWMSPLTVSPGCRSAKAGLTSDHLQCAADQALK